MKKRELVGSSQDKCKEKKKRKENSAWTAYDFCLGALRLCEQEIPQENVWSDSTTILQRPQLLHIAISAVKHLQLCTIYDCRDFLFTWMYWRSALVHMDWFKF